MKLGPHVSQQLGLVCLEQQPLNRLLWDPVDLFFHGLADGMHNSAVPLFAVVRCSFCSVWDWPCGSSHGYAEHPEFLSVPGCIVCGFVEDLQCGLNATKPGKEPTAGHLGLPAGAGEERAM